MSDTQRSMTSTISVVSTSSKKGAIGTIPYLCPEVLEGDSPSPKSDVYSFSMIIYDCIHPDSSYPRANEYRNIEKVKLAVKQDQKPTMENGRMIADVTSLMQKCWDQNPDERPSLVDIYA